MDEFNEVTDKSVLWDLIKYKIRQITIKQGREKARQRKTYLNDVEKQLKKAEENVSMNPNNENITELEICKSRYEKAYDYITFGAILRSQVKCMRAKKNTKFFLSLL